DKDLQECYDNGYVNVKLIDHDTIKNFTNKCNRNRTCNNRATAAKKPPINKPTTQRTCNKGGECKNETPSSVDVKSKANLSSGTANPQSSGRKVSQEQGQNPADEQKSRQGSVIPQSLSGSTPSDGSDRTNGKTSQEFDDHHSTTSALAETKAKPLNAPSPSGIRGLDNSPCDPSSECVPGKYSYLTCTSREQILDTRGIQTNPSCGKTLDINNPETEDSAGKVIAGQTSSVQYVSQGISDGLHPTNRNYGSVQRADDNSHPKATDEGRTGTVVSDRENTGSELSSASLVSVPSSDEGTNGITGVDISTEYRAPDGASNSVKDSHDHPHGKEVSFIGTTYSTTPNTEITANNNDILSKVINAIQDNPQIIKTSAPIGIALLLGLLFKYTPLWRVLTKKNRKNGAGIIEELNSVVQEPSIMDDERSIPFSYGAFEYSSFDQNVY
ncbi:variable surface protein Vir18, truncated, putative, partial [Plasmodium vivax]